MIIELCGITVVLDYISKKYHGKIFDDICAKALHNQIQAGAVVSTNRREWRKGLISLENHVDHMRNS